MNQSCSQFTQNSFDQQYCYQAKYSYKTIEGAPCKGWKRRRKLEIPQASNISVNKQTKRTWNSEQLRLNLEPWQLLGCEVSRAPQNVAVLLSGGVDSSLSLALLKAAGHNCHAFYLQIWFQEDFQNFWDQCPWEEDLKYAEQVCEQLNVPLTVVPLTDQYWQHVVQTSIYQLKQGLTPNPDIMCNSTVKFGAFYNYLTKNYPQQFDRIASGHYARIVQPSSTNSARGSSDSHSDSEGVNVGARAVTSTWRQPKTTDSVQQNDEQVSNLTIDFQQFERAGHAVLDSIVQDSVAAEARLQEAVQSWGEMCTWDTGGTKIVAQNSKAHGQQVHVQNSTGVSVSSTGQPSQSYHALIEQLTGQQTKRTSPQTLSQQPSQPPPSPTTPPITDSAPAHPTATSQHKAPTKHHPTRKLNRSDSLVHLCNTASLYNIPSQARHITPPPHPPPALRAAHATPAAAPPAPPRPTLKLTPDITKDQTYFLASLTRPQIARCMFPLSPLTKTHTRELASRLRLAPSARPDSQGICFLGKVKFDEFVGRHLGTWRGPLVEWESGRVMGAHDGVWFHTVGQRKGVCLSGGPWYVQYKDVKYNIVYVTRRFNDVDKSRREVRVRRWSWLVEGGLRSKEEGGPVYCKLRHGASVYRCDVWEDGEGGGG